MVQVEIERDTDQISPGLDVKTVPRATGAVFTDAEGRTYTVRLGAAGIVVTGPDAMRVKPLGVGAVLIDRAA